MLLFLKQNIQVTEAFVLIQSIFRQLLGRNVGGAGFGNFRAVSP
jgi:hypothetical protein